MSHRNYLNKKVRFLSYLRSHKHILFRFFRLILLVTAFYLLIFLSGRFNLLYYVNIAFEKTLNFVSAPIRLVNSKVQNYQKFNVSLANLKVENIKLKQEIELYHRLKEEKEILKAENQKLKELLKFVSGKGYETLSTRVLNFSTGPYAKVAIISAGKKHGITKEEVVVSDLGVIGRVTEVYPSYAKIILVTDFNSRIPIITSISRERGIAAGNNSTLLDVLYLPENSKVKNNELIITSGDGKYYPAGIPVARITRLNDKIYAVPFLDLKTLEFVSIIKRE